MLIVMAATSVVYGLFGTGEVQQWDDPEEFLQREKEKERKGLPMNERLCLINNRTR